MEKIVEQAPDYSLIERIQYMPKEQRDALRTDTLQAIGEMEALVWLIDDANDMEVRRGR